MSEARVTEEGWALVLGASSGFGAASAMALARAGCHIAGVHLDRHSTMPEVARIKQSIQDCGRQAWFFNCNAADPNRRDETLEAIAERLRTIGLQQPARVVLHSLAFGSLLPLVPEPGSDEPFTTEKQLHMTFSVMAHSLVSWVAALRQRQMLGQGSRVFAMTSSGSNSVWPGYGAVSAAKAALEAYVRQLAVELAPAGVTVNALCAGVTDTPALRKIPSYPQMIQVALRKNPHGRLTRPEDVAAAVVALSRPETYWITGNVIDVDGGEKIVG